MSDVFSEHRVQPQGVNFDAARTAVIIVDILNDFFEEGGKMVLPGGQVLYEPLQRLMDAAYSAGMPVFWCNQSLPPNDALFKKRVPHCIEGSWGAQIVDALERKGDDIIVPKRRYSSFFGTDLDLYLRERKIEHVIVTGVVTNICVRSTCHDAFFLGYDVLLPEDCTMATSPRQQEATLYDIDTHYGTVTNLAGVLKIIEATSPPRAN